SFDPPSTWDNSSVPLPFRHGDCNKSNSTLNFLTRREPQRREAYSSHLSCDRPGGAHGCGGRGARSRVFCPKPYLSHPFPTAARSWWVPRVARDPPDPLALVPRLFSAAG